MILDQIRIKNFRQYYGLQTIRFSKDKDKNVTVIHGDNGAGKTTFLNALLWGLYGKISLPRPGTLVSEKAEAELKEGDTVEMFVEIRFRDRVRNYTIMRNLTGTKQRGQFRTTQPSLTVTIIDEKGKTIEPKNPQNMIDEIMPREMSSYFFFDGERIDNLSKEAGAEDIKEAIKTIMGLKVLERTKEHLDDVRKIFSAEVKSAATGDLSILLSKQESQEEQIEDLEQKIVEIFKNRKAVVQEKEAIVAKLREAEESRVIQTERDRLEKDLTEIQKAIKDIDQNVKTLCSNQGYLAFARVILERTQSILEDKRQKGEIPVGIKQQFVEDLLERQLCICGIKLEPGSQHYNEVAAWLSQAGTKELEDKFTEVAAGIKVMSQYRIDLFSQLKTYRSQREKQLDHQQSIEEQLDEISSKLSDKDSETIRSLERRRQELDDNIRDCDVQEGKTREAVRNSEGKLDDIKKEVKKYEALEAKTALAKKRMEACQEARDIVAKIHEAAALKTKSNLQLRINEVYTHFLRKGYYAKLNDDYSLQIIKEFGETEKTVAMSQGERQITSLAFIGALVDIAREQYEKGKNKFFRGGIYPIVMDSPFGTLDPDHRARIAQGIPTLSHQVIILVTDSQWEGDVQKQIGSRIGTEYILVNYSPKSPRPSQYEYTDIREV